MAKSKKAADPAKAAIDAVEEALKLDFGGPDDASIDAVSYTHLTLPTKA